MEEIFFGLKEFGKFKNSLEIIDINKFWPVPCFFRSFEQISEY
jgi:hypothetical protein